MMSMIKRKKPIGREAAKLRMADLCARSEQCESEIRTKLVRLGLVSGDVDGVIRELKEGRFVDNARYARAFARDKMRFAGWGRRKIAAALVAKRIASTDIREAIDELDGDEYAETVMRAARSKGRGLDLSTAEDRAKLLRHLASRGFEAGICYKAIDTLRREGREE